MNSLQAKLMMTEVFSCLTEFMENKKKATEIRDKARDFFVQNSKRIVGEHGLTESILNKKDQSIHDKMFKKARELENPDSLVINLVKKSGEISSDKSLTDIQYELFSSDKIGQISNILNHKAKTNHIIAKRYFTGIDGAVLIYCIAIEYIPKAKIKK